MQQSSYSTSVRPTDLRDHAAPRRIVCQNRDTNEMRDKRQERQSLDLQFKQNHVASHERPIASRLEDSKNVTIPFERYSMVPNFTPHPYTQQSNPSRLSRDFFLDKHLKQHGSSDTPRSPSLSTPSHSLHANIYNNFSEQTRRTTKRAHYDMTQRNM